VRADAAQRIDQIADRPLVHARHARKAILAARECERRGEGPQGGAGVAEKELGFLDREGPPTPSTRAPENFTPTFSKPPA
jgi:hypothetical protein